MNIIAHGIDLIECARIADVLNRHRDRFCERILTEAERARAAEFKDPLQHIAGRFAAKEAILKVLGTGWRGQISWKDIEILNNAAGQPQVALKGECGRVAEKMGIASILLSITHTKDHAAASAIGLA